MSIILFACNNYVGVLQIWYARMGGAPQGPGKTAKKILDAEKHASNQQHIHKILPRV